VADQPVIDPGDEDLVASSSRLCRACGACCNGAYLAYVELTDEEARRLRRRLPVVAASADRPMHFLQPCPGHDAEEGCTLYADRPSPCVGYACKLLRALRAGEIDVTVALRKVQAIRQLHARLDASLPAGPGRVSMRAVALEHTGGANAAAARREHAQTLLDLRALTHLIERDLAVDPG
jgi:hypothetical protein